MRNFIPTDVHIVWARSKHLKTRGIIPRSPEDPPLGFLQEAQLQGKPVVVCVKDIRRHTARSTAAHYYFNIACAREYEAHEEPVRPDIVMAYWRTQVGAPRQELWPELGAITAAYDYKPAEVFAGIEFRIVTDHQHDRHNLISREPRLRLYPAYGIDYRSNMQDVISLSNLNTWMPALTVAAEAIKRQFFPTGEII